MKSGRSNFPRKNRRFEHSRPSQTQRKNWNHSRHQDPPSQKRAHAFAPAQDAGIKAFFAGTAIDPTPRIVLENGSNELSMRAMDLVAPIGMGQRGLIVAPPGSGKTTLLKHLCQAVAKSAPEVKLYCLLVDERPEEVTDFKRQVTAEVRSSSADESYEHHIEVADQLMRQAMQEAGAGNNVMVVIDSLTRLSRVHNAGNYASGRTLSGGLDAGAMEIPRRIFGSARKIENGGSLTIIATILVDTGSRMDQVIFEEFKGTGNMELVLSREIAQQRIYPAIDIAKSGTRKEELLFNPQELEKVRKLRSKLAGEDHLGAILSLLNALKHCSSNADFLSQI